MSPKRGLVVTFSLLIPFSMLSGDDLTGKNVFMIQKPEGGFSLSSIVFNMALSFAAQKAFTALTRNNTQSPSTVSQDDCYFNPDVSAAQTPEGTDELYKQFMIHLECLKKRNNSDF